MVMRDQTTKTVARVLYEQFLSDHGTKFTSTLVEELCAAFGIQKCGTTAYHQTLFQMIGKLASDKKAQWEQHLP